MDDQKQGGPPPEGEEPPVAPYAGEAVQHGRYGAPPETKTAGALVATGGSRQAPPAPPDSGGDDDDGGMLRMSFLEHLEELRSRIIRALMGLVVAFLASLLFANYLWNIISAPALEALTNLKVNPPKLAMTQPMEGFSIIWVKLPLLASIFLASPWILYQVWAFIAPGLYKKERRMATPFILTTAGLFISGGLFAYYFAFRYGLQFLLGIGTMNNVQPVVTVTEYFDLFVNVILGVALVFELPVLIFFLTLLRIASPRFLMRHSRYAILAIVVAAAIITPTPDVFNLMLFAVPMNLLYFIGVFASYLLVLRREGRKFPWRTVSLFVLGAAAAIAALVFFAVTRFGYHFAPHWPFLIR